MRWLALALFAGCATVPAGPKLPEKVTPTDSLQEGQLYVCRIKPPDTIQCMPLEMFRDMRRENPKAER